MQKLIEAEGGLRCIEDSFETGKNEFGLDRAKPDARDITFTLRENAH